MIGARYLTPALVAPRPLRVVVAGQPRAYAAALVATCFRGEAPDTLAARLHEAALGTSEILADALPLAERRRLVGAARRFQAAARASAWARASD